MDYSGQQRSGENRHQNLLSHDDVIQTSTAIQRLNIRSAKSDHCIPCAIAFENNFSRASHFKSEEHSVMILVTGLGFFEVDSENSDEFPPIYYCVLCNVFFFEHNSYLDHLKGKVHKEMAQFLRCLYFRKGTIFVGIDAKEPRCVEDFENLGIPLPNYCKLCNMQFNMPSNLEDHIKDQSHIRLTNLVKNCKFCHISYVDADCYDRHLETDFHKRMEDFARKMLVNENEEKEKTKTQSHVLNLVKLKSLHYCGLCNIEFNDLESYRKHENITLHRRLEQLTAKMSFKIDTKCAIELFSKPNLKTNVDSGIHYCELCQIWCSNFTENYGYHEKCDKEHARKRSERLVKNWNCS